MALLGRRSKTRYDKLWLFMTGIAPPSSPCEPGPDLPLLVPAGVPDDVPQVALAHRLDAIDSLEVDDALLEVRREQQKIMEFGDAAREAVT
jgi:hypothetical protein